MIGDKLKAMSEALASGEPLPEIDNNDLGGDADVVVVVVMMMVVMMMTMVKTTLIIVLVTKVLTSG